jgi:uncharacterized protein
MSFITSVEQLAELYGVPNDASTVKEVDRIIPEYRALIAASPFAVLATSGPEGLDCSPRGEGPGFVRVEDERTLLLPDRRGNNRIDSLRNIVRDPRAALIFLIPGIGTTLRVNGRARVSSDEERRGSFIIEGQLPRSVIVLSVDAVYFQCARAIVRSELWNPANHREPASLPTPGQILASLSDGDAGGKAYDDSWSERAAKTMW